jgi:hypothetical protein
MMNKTMFAVAGALATLGLLGGGLAEAKNFGDWMNPSKWFGGDRDYDRDYYYRRGWGYPGYGWGYPGYGWGYPGYGWGYPGYGYGYPQQQAPASSTTPAPPPTPQ